MILLLSKVLDLFLFLIIQIIPYFLGLPNSKIEHICESNCIENYCSLNLLTEDCVCFNNNYTAYCSDKIYVDTDGYKEYYNLGIYSILGFFILNIIEISIMLLIIFKIKNLKIEKLIMIHEGILKFFTFLFYHCYCLLCQC